jgi:purine-binding chemotaxis protein CheW
MRGSKVQGVEAMDEKKKFLVVKLKKNYYCLPLAIMREVIVAGDITPLPNSESSYVGVINLRGEIISIVDLAERIGLGKSSIVAAQSCIVIAQKNEVTIGMLVDAIVAVRNVEAGEILMPQAKLQENQATQNFVAAFTQDKELNELLLLLDFDKILASSITHKEEGSP